MQLGVYLRGSDNGVLHNGDPVRIAVIVTPAAGTQEPVRLSAPPGAPWTAGVRVRLHREDGKAIGPPAWSGSPRLEREIDISAAHPAGGIWCWSASVTEALPPGIYRVSARLVPPAGAAKKAGAASPVAETLFTLAPAPEVMTPAQRTRWHFELAMVAFHAGDRARATRLVGAVLAGQPQHEGARRLQSALAGSPLPDPRAAAVPASSSPVVAPREPSVDSAAGQWAVSARASSEYRPTDYSALQATGAPNVTRHGDHARAWAPKLADGGEEWIELTFAQPVRATEVRVVQNFNPGAIMRIEVIDEAGTAAIVWTGPDKTVYAKNEIGTLAAKFPVTEKPIARVKLVLDAKVVAGSNEIDAVQLLRGAP